MRAGEIIFNAGNYYVVEGSESNYKIFHSKDGFSVLKVKISFPAKPEYARRRAIKMCGNFAAKEEAEKKKL